MGTVLNWNEVPAINETQEDRDRKACVQLSTKAEGANRELAQWLIDHPSYPNTTIAKWLGCSELRIRSLRKWANNGFIGTHRTGTKIDRRSNQPLKTNDNFQDDDMEPSDDVADPAHILENILDDIDQAKTVAEAYRKILKRSPFDRGAKAEISNAIDKLIVKWRIVQSTLGTKKG